MIAETLKSDACHFYFHNFIFYFVKLKTIAHLRLLLQGSLSFAAEYIPK
ncbi:hypothetical protein HDE69_002456 [Pedobacter cryoconitis]|uniref:Uncharacterized protein n=1 Tax=Pedobacter cryoconitis TaxID=188932 RepID=A0A7W8YT93_9SPHI|nr:hypothetical protein [Pedobacter cryoconitis]MBB5643730.1 hypothetical protein [Pedobacter cryoconitis]